MTTGAMLMTVLAGTAFFVSLGLAYMSDDKQSLAILEGMGGAAFMAAVTFWLGSSAGSRRKDEVIAVSSPPQPEATEPRSPSPVG